jgi:hypothetical protein
MMPGDLVKRVVEACRWAARGEVEGFGEGVLRLMGVGRMRRVSVLREASEEFVTE